MTIYDTLKVTGSIRNVTRTGLSEILWFLAVLDRFVSKLTNYTNRHISDENYSALRNGVINLGFISNNSSSIGNCSCLQSSYNYIMYILLRFKTKILEVTVDNWCGI
jgi:hypothetical protein